MYPHGCVPFCLSQLLLSLPSYFLSSLLPFLDNQFFFSHLCIFELRILILSLQ
ncbi:hypothetical protein Peur_029970 [Populus x canadensis]